MDDTVMKELKRRLAETDRLDVSRYQFINMDRLRRAAGAEWPSIRTRVFLAASSIIERRVAEADLIIPCATGFLVIFNALSGKKAEQTTRSIREEMERFFLGDKQLSELGVEAFAEKLSLAEFEAAIAGDDIEFVDDIPEPTKASDADKQSDIITGLSYFPVWDARMEAAASYFVEPTCPDDSLRGTKAFRPEKADARLEFDLQILNEAVKSLGTLIETGSRCALIIPAGFSSTSLPRTRARFVTALSQLPDAIKPLVWVRLEGAPLNAPSSIMGETGRILMGQAKHLYVDMRLDAVSIESQVETGTSFVGASLPGTHRLPPRADLDRIVALARRKSVSVYLHGVHRFEDLQAAMHAGVQQIAGRSVGVFDAPRAPFRLTSEALMASAS